MRKFTVASSSRRRFFRTRGASLPPGFCFFISLNPTGNSGLATGGTGDVLSGVVGAFLAQHLAPFDAALAATWIHGRAAEDLAAAGAGPAGLTAGELAPSMRSLLNRLLARRGGNLA